MEHQKRRRMQHKVELSTLLRLVVASSNAKVTNSEHAETVCRNLAEEAIESVKHNDLSFKSYKLSA